VRNLSLLPFIAGCLALAATPTLRAGDATALDASALTTGTDATDDYSTPPSHITATYELDADTSYVGAARTNFGHSIQGNVSELEGSGKLVVGLQQSADSPIFRFGLSYQRYDFGLSKVAPIPDALQAENLVVGADFSLFTSWLVRVEADPGFYNDARSDRFKNFNVPFALGGSYIASEEVQWVVGLGIDFNRQFPVIPAIGVRWQLNDSWVVDAVLPTPRIEYQWSENLTLFLGADVDDGTYRLSSDFPRFTRTVTTETTVTERKVIGTRIAPGPGQFTPIYATYKTQVESTKTFHRPPLDNAVVEYDEVRLGAGFTWKATKALTLELEGGYLPYREFDFHRADVHYSNNDGAAYGRMSLNAQF
jgi:hypothetical protein